MDVRTLQVRIGTPADGKWGPSSKAALGVAFTNPKAPSVNDDELGAFAKRLGCTVRQIRAVSMVESSGGGFDRIGRPKILFERHVFHRMTNGRWSPSTFSNSAYGGYDQPSWSKLEDACGCNPDAAFSATSWGKFQVLGSHWRKLGYASAFDLAHSTVGSEAAHYELLVRYIETFGLKQAIRDLSTNPETCRAFASGYNGAGYRRNAYHEKLARAMQ